MRNAISIEKLEEMTDNCIDWVVRQFDRLPDYFILWAWIIAGLIMMIALVIKMIMRG